MTILKCKMCGGNIEVLNGNPVGICNCCGTTTTLPKIDDDRLATIFNRANHFRMSGKFDQAATVYERIIEEDDSNAEAHWGVVLCKFGIEYVEDPDSHKRIPTCHRAGWDSILNDLDYLDALKYAEPDAKAVYEKEAKYIDSIQKGILSISKSEDPYDIFICYKESTDGGSRTKDSVLAQDLYNHLIKAGYRVFFSRITLEGKVGIQYEPYIFSALNSAKVMLVVGTSDDNFNATWVKNEWSRFLQLCKKDGNKRMIPCYRDMDAYDMPEELRMFQSQDMGKIGFEQDLLRGIEKIIGKSVNNESVKQSNTSNSNNSITPLLERAFMFLEDGNWSSAIQYCERVLDQDPKNVQAYLGKLMADCHVHRQGELKYCAEPFDKNSNYKKVLRFGSDTLANSLKSDIAYIRDNNEAYRKILVYNNALKAMKSAKSEKDFWTIEAQLQSISGYKDADSLASECAKKAKELFKDTTYSAAKKDMDCDTIDGYVRSIKEFKMIPGWKDADELLAICQQKIDKIKEKEESDRIEAKCRAEKKRIETERQIEKERLAKKRAAEETALAEERKRKAKRKRKFITCIASIMCVSLLAVGWKFYPQMCGLGLKWSFDDATETLTISGSGHMWNYNQKHNPPWENEKHRIKQLIINEDVSSIGDSAFAFASCENLSEIIVNPDNASYISVDNVLYSKDMAELIFYPSSKTDAEFVIPESVNIIKNYAFTQCNNITSITIPNKATVVERDAFEGCNGITIIYPKTKEEWSLFGVDIDCDIVCLDGIYPGRENEPNNSIENPNYISLNKPYKAQLSKSSDVDCFLFELLEERTVQIVCNSSCIVVENYPIIGKFVRTPWWIYLKDSKNNMISEFGIRADGREKYSETFKLKAGEYILIVKSSYPYRSDEYSVEVRLN